MFCPVCGLRCGRRSTRQHSLSPRRPAARMPSWHFHSSSGTLVNWRGITQARHSRPPRNPGRLTFAPPGWRLTRRLPPCRKSGLTRGTASRLPSRRGVRTTATHRCPVPALHGGRHPFASPELVATRKPVSREVIDVRQVAPSWFFTLPNLFPDYPCHHGQNIVIFTCRLCARTSGTAIPAVARQANALRAPPFR
jgi:hypothetical protein